MNRYEYYHLMDPISTWGGTFTAPNLAWYDFSATVSTTIGDSNNVVDPTYKYWRKAYDWTGNGCNLDTFTGTFSYSTNTPNGKACAAGTNSSPSGYNQLSGNFGSWSDPWFSWFSASTVFMVSRVTDNAIYTTFQSVTQSTVGGPVWNYYVALGNVAGVEPYSAAISTTYSSPSIPNLMQTYGTFSSFGYMITMMTQSGFGSPTSSMWPSINQNENSIISATSGTSGFGASPIKRCQLYIQGNSTNNAIMEVMIYKRVLTPSEISNVYAYLSNKWAIYY